MSIKKQTPMEKRRHESKPSESSESQAGNSPSSEHIIEEVSECEIFTIVKAIGRYHICLGNEVCAKKAFGSIKEAEEYIYSKPWELIMTATAVFQKRAEALQKMMKK